MFARPGSGVNRFASISKYAEVMGTDAQPMSRVLAMPIVIRFNLFIGGFFCYGDSLGCHPAFAAKQLHAIVPVRVVDSLREVVAKLKRLLGRACLCVGVTRTA